MRAALMEMKVHRDDDGNIVGLATGADRCAEHEWGVKPLRQALGCPGFKARDYDTPIHPLETDVIRLENSNCTVHLVNPKKVPDGTTVNYSDYFLFVDKCTINKRKMTVLAMIESCHAFNLNGTPQKIRDIVNMAINEWVLDRDELAAGWDENEFVIATDREDVAEYLKQLPNKIANGEIIMTLGAGANPFSNGAGITLIEAEVCTEMFDEVVEDRTETRGMYKRVEETGIEKKLKKAGRTYYALSPRIFESGELKFWLNPHNQQNNNWGYFTVDELLQWIDNEGPIPKK